MQHKQFGGTNACQLHFKDEMQAIFRVNQAGENGAVLICEAMIAAINAIPEIPETTNKMRNQKLEILKALQTMLDQELEHQAFFTNIVAKTKTRPTIFSPLWKVGAYAISFGSTILGKNFAMNAIVAIEDAIEKHYFKQRQQLQVISHSIDEFCGIKIEEIISKINQFEQEEVEHGNLASRFVDSPVECVNNGLSVNEVCQAKHRGEHKNATGNDAVSEFEKKAKDNNKCLDGDLKSDLENDLGVGLGGKFLQNDGDTTYNFKSVSSFFNKTLLGADLHNELQSKKEKISAICEKKAINLHYKIIRSFADVAIELSKRW